MSDAVFVCAPLANLRREPIDLKYGYVHDELQETQVLYNEKLLLKKIEKGWCYVEAEEQKSFKKENKWQGYPGWIKADNIIRTEKIFENKGIIIIKNKFSFIFKEPNESSEVLLTLLFGTKLFIIENNDSTNFYRVMLHDGQTGWIKKKNVFLIGGKLKESQIRQNILQSAQLFIGSPYLWGGRSMHSPFMNIPTGVDCSGLVNLLFRVVNIELPRDAHDQYLVSEDICSDELDIGDLIFISDEGNHEKIVHVMIYAGKGNIIESYESGSFVREISFFDRFGIKFSDIKETKIKIGDRLVYFKRIKI